MKKFQRLFFMMFLSAGLLVGLFAFSNIVFGDTVICYSGQACITFEAGSCNPEYQMEFACSCDAAPGGVASCSSSSRNCGSPHYQDCANSDVCNCDYPELPNYPNYIPPTYPEYSTPSYPSYSSPTYPSYPSYSSPTYPSYPSYPPATPGTLSYECLYSPAGVKLNWTPGLNSDSNGIQKGDMYPTDPDLFWDWIGDVGLGVYTYTDYSTPGVSYSYRIKYTPLVPSNVVVADCGTTPPPPPTYPPTYPGPAPTGTLTPASSSCLIASGASSCTVDFTWITNNPAVGHTSAVTSDTNNSGATSVNFTVVTGNNGGPTPFTIPYLNGGVRVARNFYLYHNSVLLDQEQGTVVANCDSGTIWNGSICAPIPPTPDPLAMDLLVNGADHNSTATALNVQPGGVVHFSWSSFGNTSLNCWSEGGFSGDGWANASIPNNNSNYNFTTPTSLGLYEYKAKCREDTDLGLGNEEKIFSFFRLTQKALAANWVTVSDSVFINVAIPPIIDADPKTIYSGESTTITWNCPVGSTSSVGVNFSTVIPPAIIGAPSGSVTLVPAQTTTYSVICNNGSTSSVTIQVKKKPVIIED